MVVEAEREADARDWAAANALMVTNVFELEPPPVAMHAGEAPPSASIGTGFRHLNVSIVEQTHSMRGWLHQTSSIGCGIALGWAMIVVLTVSGFIVFGAAILARLPSATGPGGSRSVGPAGP